MSAHERDALTDLLTERTVRVQVVNVGTVSGFLRSESADYLADALLAAGWTRRAETPDDWDAEVETLGDFIAEQRDAHPREPADMDSSELAERVIAFLAAAGLLATLTPDKEN